MLLSKQRRLLQSVMQFNEGAKVVIPVYSTVIVLCSGILFILLFCFNVLGINRGTTERVQQKLLNVQSVRQ